MSEKDKERSADPRHRSTSSSYLVRVWRETGANAGQRFFLRDLKTGEERYLDDAKQIGDLLARGLRAKEAKETAQPERDTG